MPGQELDWIGPQTEENTLIYKVQSADGEWMMTSGLLELDPNYSEFSVRIHDPRCRSMSFIYRTLCILPKSKLREVYSLIGRYLNELDKK